MTKIEILFILQKIFILKIFFLIRTNKFTFNYGENVSLRKHLKL